MSALIHIVAWLVKKPSMARHAGSYFVLSMCDRLWHPDMSEDEALALMEKGIAEVTGCTGAVFAPMCFGAAKRCVCFALCIRSMVSHHYVAFQPALLVLRFRRNPSRVSCSHPKELCSGESSIGGGAAILRYQGVLCTAPHAISRALPACIALSIRDHEHSSCCCSIKLSAVAEVVP